jgi:hypothetical protein
MMSGLEIFENVVEIHAEVRGRKGEHKRAEDA